MGWVWDDELRSLFKMDNCDRQICKCPAQRNNTQNQIAQIQNAIARSGSAIAMHLPRAIADLIVRSRSCRVRSLRQYLF